MLTHLVPILLTRTPHMYLDTYRSAISITISMAFFAAGVFRVVNTESKTLVGDARVILMIPYITTPHVAYTGNISENHIAMYVTESIQLSNIYVAMCLDGGYDKWYNTS